MYSVKKYYVTALSLWSPLCLSFSLSKAVRAQIIVDVIKSSQPVNWNDRYIKSQERMMEMEMEEGLYVCVCVPITLVTLSPAHPHGRGYEEACPPSRGVNVSPLDSVWFIESLLREIQRVESMKGWRRRWKIGRAHV